MLGRSALLAATNSRTPGFGSRYLDPSVAVPGQAFDVKFSTSGAHLAVAHFNSPYVTAYEWASATGFGSKIANPSFIPSGSSAAAYGLRFSPDGSSLSYGYRRSPYVVSYRWSGTGFGTNYSAPSMPPAGDGYDVEYSPSGTAIAVGGFTGSSSVINLSAYRWSSATGYGTKHADPVSHVQTLGSYTYGIAFSRTGQSIVTCGSSNGATVNAYQWSDVSGFGTRFPSPAIAPSGAGTGFRRVRFSPDGMYVAIAQDAGTGSGLWIYPWSDASGFGSKIADPTVAITTPVNDAAFSPSGDAIVMAVASTPWVNAYEWSPLGFGAKCLNPSTLPLASSTGIAFSPSGDAVAICSSFSSPYVCAYRWV